MEVDDVSGEDTPAFQTGGGGGGGGAVTVAVVVGVMVMVLWRLWGRCSRQLEMRTVVEAERAALFRFLSDPENLKIIHPYTSDIRVKKETEEEGGVTLKEFDWLEKVPFTVVSAARMRCDPSTFTITLDIVPAGGIHLVQLKWQLRSDNTESSDVNEETRQAHQSTHPQESSRSTDSNRTITPDTSDDQRTITPSDSTIDKKTPVASSADGKAATDSSNSLDDESRTTEFHYQIRMTGPCVLLVYVLMKVIESSGEKLMDRLRQYFTEELGQMKN